MDSFEAKFIHLAFFKLDINFLPTSNFISSFLRQGGLLGQVNNDCCLTADLHMKVVSLGQVRIINGTYG